MTWEEFKNISIAIAALTGMALGVWNLFSDWRKQKVKLKVTPLSARCIGGMRDGSRAFKYSPHDFSVCGEPDNLAVEVINMSEFPVTVSEVGLHAPKRIHRFAVPCPEIIDGGVWPRRLESREKVVVFIDLSTLIDSDGTGLIKSAYARTDCGAYVTGNSKALKSLIKQLFV